MPKSVTFYSEGVKLAGDLLLPADAGFVWFNTPHSSAAESTADGRGQQHWQ